MTDPTPNRPPVLNAAYPGAPAWAKPRPSASPMLAPSRPLWKVMYDAATAAPQGSDDWSHCVRNAAAAEIRAIAQRLEAKQSELLEAGHTMSVDEAIRWLGYEAGRAEAGE